MPYIYIPETTQEEIDEESWKPVNDWGDLTR